MKIGPLFDGRLPASLTGRPQNKLPAGKDMRIGDSVDISHDSRKKVAQSADERLKLEQSPSPVYTREDFAEKPSVSEKNVEETDRSAMIAEIKDRVTSGFYNRHDITFLVADKLSDEFNS